MPPQPQQPQNKHFTMTATLDNTRVVKNIGNLMDEIINHLMQIDGANVEIKLLVEAHMPDGTPVNIARAIKENCATLKVDDFGFVNLSKHTTRLYSEYCVSILQEKGDRQQWEKVYLQSLLLKF